MTIPDRLSALRTAMREHGIDYYFLGSADPHQSEYVAPHWQSRVWFSGFDGSAGTLIVSATTAKLWTDSRYFIQAEQQLAGTGIELMKLRVPHTPEYLEWLTEVMQADQVLGMDGSVVSVATAERLENVAQDVGASCELRYDLAELAWPDRPPLPATEPYEHSPEFTETPRRERLARLQQFVREEGLAHYLLIGLDEIAWTLGIRGADVAYNPLCLSYLLVSPQGARWFVGPDRVPQDLQENLAADGVALAEYGEILPALLQLGGTNDPIGMDASLASVSVYQAAGGIQVQKIASPVPAWKALKGPREVAHFRAAMARDGVALLRLRRWLDQEGIARNATEVEIADQLTAFRAEQQHYAGDSFPAIVGYRGNGAIVHYHAQPEACAAIGPEGLLLLDSGGQYHDGTTDITRTFALGTPTADEKLHFTLVLQGHIDLGMARFPRGTTGVQLDTLARAPLWQHQLNYGHGTGHGVGFFLNVHEGPMSISPNAKANGPKVALEPGMVISNEPGFYLPGQHGIRTENLVLVVEEAAGWMAFETLSLFPIDKSLILADLLSEAQRKWLDDYHQKVAAAIDPLLSDPAEKAWLAAACAPL